MSDHLQDKKIIIVDFGSQYTQLIARRVRELGVYCEICIAHSLMDLLNLDESVSGVILSGGPETVTSSTTPRVPDALFDYGLPVLGVCYGMQAMVAQLGGEVMASDTREFGYAQLKVLPHPLFEAVSTYMNDLGDAVCDVWMSHGDKVTSLPSGFDCIATTDNTPYAAICDNARQFYGVQFHPEVTHTQQGDKMLSAFVFDICHCTSNWTSSTIVDETVDQVRQQVGREHVIVGLSGGVDSAVVAALLAKAIGDQLVCIFVDTGLLRLNEADQVMKVFSEHLSVKVIKVDARQRFYTAIKGVTDPEEKRKIIGNDFITIFEEEAAKLSDCQWLAQGTIYPDIIESAKSEHGQAHVIKSHHNVGGLPEKMHLKLIEPLRQLFKDEVRKIGEYLGLPHELVYRHPFPGPGLALRIIGEVTSERVAILQQADAIFIEELRAHDWYHKVSQAFAVFLPIKTVGVKGDARVYEYVIGLRSVETIDFMTARWSHLPYELLSQVSHRIINEVPHVSRVVYDISGKPPATIEWE